jgi:hypothetical protein
MGIMMTNVSCLFQAKADKMKSILSLALASVLLCNLADAAPATDVRIYVGHTAAAKEHGIAIPAGCFTAGRKQRYEKLSAITDGQNGTLVAPLPLEMRFTRDRFNEGVIGEWYAPDFDDSHLGSKDTFYTWDAQDEPEDEKGHDYDGHGWYRGEIDVPNKFKNRHLPVQGRRD